MNLETLLNEYKNITEQYMNNFENLEEANRLLSVRDEILDKIKSSNVNKAELKAIVDKLGIMELEQKAMSFTLGESQKVKQEMIELRRSKNANTTYNTSFKDRNFINKRI